MKQMIENPITVVRVKFENLEVGLQDAKITTLLSSGYYIVHIIPIEDGGIPMALIFLCKRTENKSRENHKLMLYITIFMLVQTFIYIYLITHQ